MADYYGNNDWRDYLAHYGVKGMKWRKHKYITGEDGHYTYQLGNFVSRFGRDSYPTNRWGYRTTGRYVSVGNKNKQLRVNLTKTTNKRQGKTWYSGFTSAGATKDGSTKSKKLGRLTFTRDEDGTSVEYEKKNKKKKSSKGTTIKEKTIRETVIPEQFIKEKVISANSPFAKAKKTSLRYASKTSLRYASKTRSKVASVLNSSVKKKRKR